MRRQKLKKVITTEKIKGVKKKERKAKKKKNLSALVKYHGRRNSVLSRLKHYRAHKMENHDYQQHSAQHQMNE